MPVIPGAGRKVRERRNPRDILLPIALRGGYAIPGFARCVTRAQE